MRNTIHIKNKRLNQLRQKQLEEQELQSPNGWARDAKIGTNDIEELEAKNADYFKDFSTNTGPDIHYML